MNDEIYHELTKDLQFLFQCPTMEEPPLSNGIQSTEELLKREEYKMHFSFLKNYKAKGFTKDHLGKKLKENIDFVLKDEYFGDDHQPTIVKKETFAIPISCKNVDEPNASDEMFPVEVSIPERLLDIIGGNRMINYYQTVPNSHSWDSFEMLLNWVKYHSKPIDPEYLMTGLENSIKHQQSKAILSAKEQALPTPSKDNKEQLSFQTGVQEWVLACFGEKIAKDVTERNHRFIEEALELVQSTGITKSECLQLVDYVFNRPIGERIQEVGGVIVTLAALCSAIEIDLNAAGEQELKRVWGKIDAIRIKQAAKPKNSPLPQAVIDKEQGEEDKLNNFTIPMNALKYACDYFGKKNLPEFTDTATDQEKWLFNELSIAYEAGAKSQSKSALPAEEQDAVEFADFIKKSYMPTRVDKWMRNFDNWNGDVPDMEEYTTQQLYELFKQSKK